MSTSKSSLKLRFVEVPEPADEALQAVLHKVITRTMKLLTCRGALVEEQGQAQLATTDGDSHEARSLRPLQDVDCQSRILELLEPEFAEPVEGCR